MLNAEQRLDAFEKQVAYRSRNLPRKVNRFSNQWLIPVAQDFLNSTSWPEADTAEGLVERLRERRAQKIKARKEKNAAARKKKLLDQAARDLQGLLL